MNPFRPNAIVLAALVAVGGYFVLTSMFHSPTAKVQTCWALMGAVGFILTFGNLWSALRDRESLIISGRNGDLLIMANAAVRQELIRVSQMFSVMSTGLYLLTTQPVLTEAQRRQLHIPQWTVASVIITVLLFWVVGGIVMNAFFDRRVRQRFLQ